MKSQTRTVLFQQSVIFVSFRSALEAVCKVDLDVRCEMLSMYCGEKVWPEKCFFFSTSGLKC